jgi:hypothetical protein
VVYGDFEREAGGELVTRRGVDAIAIVQVDRASLVYVSIAAMRCAVKEFFFCGVDMQYQRVNAQGSESKV